MDPRNNSEPALRLPQPMPDQSAWRQVSGAQPERAPSGEVGLTPPQAAPMAPSINPAMPVQQFQQQVAVQSQVPVSAQPVADVAQSTDDDRLWIERAKRIVEQTHADPFLESQEIGKFKAEYLRDRHAKNIKAAEG